MSGKNTSEPKIVFIYDHKYPTFWMDGLSAALDILSTDFEIVKNNLNDASSYINNNGGLIGDEDFVLGWGAFGSKVDNYMQQLSEYKKGLCIAGNAQPPKGANKYDVLFYETKWYRPQINFHPNIIHAFGVNTDIFFPSDMSIILFDYLGVGSFSNWKRWEKMKGKRGVRMVIGEYQKENEDESLSIVKDLLRYGVMVSDMINPIDLSRFYSSSRTVYMPSDIYGGGERTVLEARSCGCNVEIEPDNPKLKELLNWNPIPDHIWYAKQLKKGILSCLN